MVEITEKDWDTTVRNSYIQDAEKLFFKSSWFINIHYRKPFVSSILNLNHASLILGDATDKDTITNVSATGRSGGYNATVIPRMSSSIINPPVLKFADADPGNGNAPHQYGAENQNNANGNGAAYPNAPGCNIFADANGNHGGGGGGDGEHGNGNGGNDNNGIGNGYGVGIRIHRVEVYISGRILRPTICTNISANDYNSWHGFSEAIHEYWPHLNDYENEGDFEVEDIGPFNCWPGWVAGFGRLEGGQVWHAYRWFEHSWDAVRMLIKDVFMYKAMYDEEPFLREMPHENGFAQIREGGVFNALEIMDWLAPYQVDDGDYYDEIGGDDNGNGNGNGVSDGGNGNGDDGDHGRNGNGDDGDDGGNGNGVDGDDGGNGNGVDGDEGGNGSGNGGKCSEGYLGLLICSIVLSFTIALVIRANRKI